MTNNITVIEFSPSGIKLLVGYVYENNVYILDKREINNIEIDDNGFINKNVAVEGLKNLLSSSENYLKTKLTNFVIILPPDDFVTKEDSLSTYLSTNVITCQAYKNVAHSLSVQLCKDDSALANLVNVYVHPNSFKVDSNDWVKEFPLNKMAERFSLDAYGQFISKLTYDYYIESIIKSSCNISPYLSLVSPYAISVYISGFKNAPSPLFILQLENNHNYSSYSKDGVLLKSQSSLIGIDEAIKKTALKYSLSIERTKQIITQFGLNEDRYPYITDEGIKLFEIQKTFKDSLDVLDDVFGKIDEIDPSHTVPLILFGKSIMEIDGIINALGDRYSRKISVFNNKVIGARDKEFASLVGAIKISSFPYMIDKEENQIKEQNEQFSRSQYRRG